MNTNTPIELDLMTEIPPLEPDDRVYMIPMTWGELLSVIGTLLQAIGSDGSEEAMRFMTRAMMAQLAASGKTEGVEGFREIEREFAKRRAEEARKGADA